MTNDDLDKILSELDAVMRRKKEILLVKARTEIDTLDREATAYYDGAYDAIKVVKQRLAAEAHNGNND